MGRSKTRRKGKNREILSSGHATSNIIMLSPQMIQSAMSLQQTEPINSHAWVRGSSPSLLNDAWIEADLFFAYIPIDELIRLCWIVTNICLKKKRQINCTLSNELGLFPCINMNINIQQYVHMKHIYLRTMYECESMCGLRI